MARLAKLLTVVLPVPVVLAIGKWHAAWVGHYVFHTSRRLPWALAYASVFIVTAYILGLPDRLSTPRTAAAASLASGAVATGFVAFSGALGGSPLLPRLVLVGSTIALVPIHATVAMILREDARAPRYRDRVLAVIAPDSGAALRTEVILHGDTGAAIVAVVDPVEAADLHTAAAACRPTMLLLDHRAQHDPDVVAAVAQLHAGGLRVRTVLDFYEQRMGKLPIGELGGLALLCDVGELHNQWYARLKRIADLLLAVPGLVVLALVAAVVAVVNTRANRGALVFRQTRVGRGGDEFTLYKFRTMSSDRDGPGHGEWTAVDDCRVTPFGRWLRRTHLDELPQLLNIVRGDLSFVGPRPEQPAYVSLLREKVPFYDARHIVRPGLTGWAQVNYPYAASIADSVEKLQYDLYYVRHQTLRLDGQVVARTLRHVVRAAGR